MYSINQMKSYTIIILVAIFFVYMAMASSAINEKQMVVGDMTTQYVIKRMAEGKTLYQEVPAFYGPTMYLVGASLVSIGLTYSGLKIFMLGIAILSGILIYLITKKVFKNEWMSLLSTAIYMFLPIHYGVAPIFHADSFAVLFMLITLYFLLLKKNFSFILAGIFAAIAIYSKMPVIPLVIAPIFYFALYKKKEGLLYIISLLAIIILGMIYINIISENYDNTRFFIDYLLKEPDPPFEILRDFAWIEGFAFLIAILGFIIYIKKVKKKSLLIFVALFSPLGFAAILMRGVGIYEANYMEPFIAIFASFAIFYLKDRWVFKRGKKILPFLLIMLIFVQITIFVWPDRERVADWDGNRWTKQANEIADGHTQLLEKYTSKGDIVMASPMAVYRTDRILPLENPFNYVLKIQHGFGYESASNEVSILRKMVENKEIKMLITYNSTKKNDPKYNDFQENRFFPFYTKPFSDLLFQNYEKFEENGFYYYLPRS